MKIRVWLLLMCAVVIGCVEKEEQGQTEYPMFWTWLDYKSSTFENMCVIMEEAGIEAVMLNAATSAEMSEAVAVAEKHGIEVYAWIWTLNFDHEDAEWMPEAHKEWMSMNRMGWSLADSVAYVKHYKFMCPILPEVRYYVREKVRDFCKVEGLKGVSIDYNRMVDVVLPTQLWEKYGILQDKDYPEWDYGYHPAMVEAFMAINGYDPRKREDPTNDNVWRQFRCDKVTEIANEVSQVVRASKKVMAASPFPTPGMGRELVRQDWGKWELDIVFPMAYHSFYTGEKSFISDCMKKNKEGNGEEMKLYCGLLLTSEDTTELVSLMDEALNNGAEGIAIFTVEALKTKEMREKFRSYADEMRKRRSKGEIPVKETGEIEMDPFKKVGIMERVEGKIASYMKKEVGELQLGQYCFIEEYGSVKHYRVADEKTGTLFDVRFFFHGGILSGWDVRPLDSLTEK
ncbi:MAG: family 10 glycosylhydrolase [Tannerellaceae bacterium]|jgi:uncharacterized lipoprotein YddW (UPF0748 family)|nr:family 10 glycosylhydrolase [Tannerellaceae bacterium]